MTHIDKRLRHPTPGDGIIFNARTTSQMQQGDLLIWVVIRKRKVTDAKSNLRVFGKYKAG
jgi:hypothetical protein